MSQEKRIELIKQLLEERQEANSWWHFAAGFWQERTQFSKSIVTIY